MRQWEGRIIEFDGDDLLALLEPPDGSAGPVEAEFPIELLPPGPFTFHAPDC